MNKTQVALIDLLNYFEGAFEYVKEIRIYLVDDYLPDVKEVSIYIVNGDLNMNDVRKIISSGKFYLQRGIEFNFGDNYCNMYLGKKRKYLCLN